MSFVKISVPTTISAGSITVTPTPPAVGTLSISTVETLAGFSISAGAYRVLIKHVGSGIEVAGTPGTDADFTVNGQTVTSGMQLQFDAVLDPAAGAAGTYKTLPAIAVVNGGGAGIWYQVTS